MSDLCLKTLKKFAVCFQFASRRKQGIDRMCQSWGLFFSVLSRIKEKKSWHYQMLYPGFRYDIYTAVLAFIARKF